ncbi:MAG: 16S rRNA (guanine(527)-N(7))-methyltransferase RsmG [Deltaproteobacteria bacterium]|jgi:16S rRNA (guanine527-N7)-methyltransferase|nr:16S rRNA (guanine(527)-N(7))-methyltransferase RsmG [Deltaproteobacteria bacterium]MBW2500551.1 16S rRNA (guanine(527)-N(7))-methyltransferase RsmG [Deltaproteobacteria bacterium]
MSGGDPADSTDVEVSSVIERGLAALELPASAHQIRDLTGLIDVLSRWAPRINLTGHRDPVEMARRLVLDAAALSKVLPELASSRSLADLGSGAGFPGLPLAILNPHLEVYLVESRQKRNHFQRAARRALGLARVHPILGRSDAIAVQPCDGVISQAMAQPEAALELMLPWVAKGGWLALPGSAATSAPRRPPELRRLEERTYRVPGTEVERKLWVGRLGSD